MGLRRDIVLTSSTALLTAAVVLLVRPYEQTSPGASVANGDTGRHGDDTIRKSARDQLKSHSKNTASAGVRARSTPLADASGLSRDPELDRLRQVVELQEAAIRDLSEQLYGTELAWPTDTPPEQTEGGFTDAIDDVLSTCQLAVDRIQVECSEPPCIAVLDGVDFEGKPVATQKQKGNPGSVQSCGPWTQRYGTSSRLSTTTLDCENGVSRRVYMISPAWPKPPEGQKLSREELEKQARRWNRRTSDLADQVCDHHRVAEQRSSAVMPSQTAPHAHDIDRERRERHARIDELRLELGLDPLRV